MQSAHLFDAQALERALLQNAARRVLGESALDCEFRALQASIPAVGSQLCQLEAHRIIGLGYRHRLPVGNAEPLACLRRERLDRTVFSHREFERRVIEDIACRRLHFLEQVALAREQAVNEDRSVRPCGIGPRCLLDLAGFVSELALDGEGRVSEVQGGRALLRNHDLYRLVNRNDDGSAIGKLPASGHVPDRLHSPALRCPKRRLRELLIPERRPRLLDGVHVACNQKPLGDEGSVVTFGGYSHFRGAALEDALYLELRAGKRIAVLVALVHDDARGLVLDREGACHPVRGQIPAIGKRTARTGGKAVIGNGNLYLPRLGKRKSFRCLSFGDKIAASCDKLAFKGSRARNRLRDSEGVRFEFLRSGAVGESGAILRHDPELRTRKRDRSARVGLANAEADQGIGDLPNGDRGRQRRLDVLSAQRRLAGNRPLPVFDARIALGCLRLHEAIRSPRQIGNEHRPLLVRGAARRLLDLRHRDDRPVAVNVGSIFLAGNDSLGNDSPRSVGTLLFQGELRPCDAASGCRVDLFHVNGAVQRIVR